MHRYDLTDAEWAVLEPFFPDRYHHGKVGRPWKDHRPLVNGIRWHLHTGAPWPDSPNATGPGKLSPTASTAGARTAPGPRSSTLYYSASTTMDSSTVTSGVSMPRLSAPAARRPGRKKN
jgi:transposase